jgi:hypothetical protein
MHMRASDETAWTTMSAIRQIQVPEDSRAPSGGFPSYEGNDRHCRGVAVRTGGSRKDETGH